MKSISSSPTLLETARRFCTLRHWPAREWPWRLRRRADVPVLESSRAVLPYLVGSVIYVLFSAQRQPGTFGYPHLSVFGDLVVFAMQGIEHGVFTVHRFVAKELASGFAVFFFFLLLLQAILRTVPENREGAGWRPLCTTLKVLKTVQFPPATCFWMPPGTSLEPPRKAGFRHAPAIWAADRSSNSNQEAEAGSSAFSIPCRAIRRHRPPDRSAWIQPATCMRLWPVTVTLRRAA